MVPTAKDFDRIYLNKQTPTLLEAIEARAVNDADITALRCTGLINAAEREQVLKMLSGCIAASEATTKTILDLGCGTGRLGIWLAQRVQANLVGIDFSPVAIKLAEQQPEAACGKYTFRVSPFDDTGIVGASIVGAFSLDAVYLARDPRAALSEVKRILRPQSPFIFTYYDDPRGAVNWAALVEDVGLRIRLILDLTESWRRTMRTKHQLRWDNRYQIGQELGRRAEAEMSVTRSMLGIDRPSYIEATSRYLVHAFKP